MGGGPPIPSGSPPSPYHAPGPLPLCIRLLLHGPLSAMVRFYIYILHGQIFLYGKIIKLYDLYLFGGLKLKRYLESAVSTAPLPPLVWETSTPDRSKHASDTIHLES